MIKYGVTAWKKKKDWMKTKKAIKKNWDIMNKEKNGDGEGH